MDRGARQATVHGVTKSWMWLSNWACMHTHTHACVRAYTSLVRAWPGTLDFPEWNSSFNTVWHFRVTAKPSYQWFSTRAILLPPLPHRVFDYVLETFLVDTPGRRTDSRTTALTTMLENSRQCIWQPPQPRNLWSKMSIVMEVGGFCLLHLWWTLMNDITASLSLPHNPAMLLK